MGDFSGQWSHVRDLDEGGQGHTYVVRRADGSDSAEYVLKRLKNLSRSEYFEREIEAYTRLDHPNLLKIVDRGVTPRGKPFIVSPFCGPGALSTRRPTFITPLDGLRFFRKICDAVAHAHKANVYHLDIKPANVFLSGEEPILGDFGICVIADKSIEWTQEGPRGSLYYCAPELRGPEIEGNVSPAASDVYSLGKLLYWLFTGQVFDGSEEDYSRNNRMLASRFPGLPELTFVDELVARTVWRDPSERIRSGCSTALTFLAELDKVIARMEKNGRVLDLSKPITCLFCATGTYSPQSEYPNLAAREAHAESRQLNRRDIYEQSRNDANYGFAVPVTGQHSIAPIVLVCSHCGNTQTFRLDRAPQAFKNWRP